MTIPVPAATPSVMFEVMSTSAGSIFAAIEPASMFALPLEDEPDEPEPEPAKGFENPPPKPPLPSGCCCEGSAEEDEVAAWPPTLPTAAMTRAPARPPARSAPPKASPRARRGVGGFWGPPGAGGVPHCPCGQDAGAGAGAPHAVTGECQG